MMNDSDNSKLIECSSDKVPLEMKHRRSGAQINNSKQERIYDGDYVCNNIKHLKKKHSKYFAVVFTW